MKQREYALEAKGLTVTFGEKVVLDLPFFYVYPQEVLAVMGPNGSGKTTLLLCLALLLKPTSGIILHQGSPVSEGTAAQQMRRKMAVVFQESLLLNNSVRDNVTLGLRLRGIKGHEVETRTRKWLERFGIAALAERQAKTLSGGEAKRVSLARSFILQPEVLFLDEPFTTLDNPTRQSLLEDFKGVLKETKVTTVMVTHDRNEALALADRVMVLIQGHIRQTGTPREVFSLPADEEVALFTEVGNVFTGVISTQHDGQVTLDIDGKQWQAISNLTVGSQVTIYVHSEDINIFPMLETPSSSDNQLKCRIMSAFPVGSQLKVTLDCGVLLNAIITRQMWEGLRLEEGQEVIASFPASAVHLISK